MIRIFLILVAGLFLVSCQKEPQIIVSNNTKIFSKFPVEEKIEFEKLVKFHYGNPREMIAIDSTLIFANYINGQDYYLHNYSLSLGKFDKPYIRKGRSSNEILGLASIGYHNNYLWLNDFTAKKMMLLDKDKVIKGDLDDFIKFSFKTNQNYYSILIDSLKIIATGNEASKFKIEIIDLPTGNVVEEFGALKSYSKDLPFPVIAQASITKTFLKPTKNKIVLAYIHTDIIEIFNLNTKKSTSLQGPEKFDSYFTFYGDRWFETEKTRVAFIGGTATNKYIYLLYSGKNFSDKNAFKGSDIFVYDWEMNPIKKIKLNTEVYQICITDNDKTLYSYDEKTKNIVFAALN